MSDIEQARAKHAECVRDMDKASIALGNAIDKFVTSTTGGSTGYISVDDVESAEHAMEAAAGAYLFARVAVARALRAIPKPEDIRRVKRELLEDVRHAADEQGLNGNDILRLARQLTGDTRLRHWQSLKEFDMMRLARYIRDDYRQRKGLKGQPELKGDRR